jgi:hypothetical protein
MNYDQLQHAYAELHCVLSNLTEYHENLDSIYWSHFSDVIEPVRESLLAIAQNINEDLLNMERE